MFSSEKLCLHVVEESSFSEEFSEQIFKFLWINIVYDVKIRDIMFILSFSSTLTQFKANGNRCRVLRY